MPSIQKTRLRCGKKLMYSTFDLLVWYFTMRRRQPCYLSTFPFTYYPGQPSSTTVVQARCVLKSSLLFVQYILSFSLLSEYKTQYLVPGTRYAGCSIKSDTTTGNFALGELTSHHPKITHCKWASSAGCGIPCSSSPSVVNHVCRVMKKKT